LTFSHGRIAGAGCCVDVAERGLLAWLRMETPRQVVHRGLEPGRWLTGKGATLLLVGPPVLAALVLAFGLLDPGMPSLPLVGALLLAALAIALLVRVGWKARADASARALDYAWTRLLPRLHAPKFAPEESAFAAGLALHALTADPPPAHQEGLSRLIGLTEKAVAEGQRAVRHLATLQRLSVADAAATGADPVPLLAAQVGRCFEQRMPPAFAEELLAGEPVSRWTRTDLARLRLLVCDHAFAGGLEVRHLLEAGTLVPALADLLRTDGAAELAQLRLLWSLRAGRPWDHCGPARTAFELAAEPGTDRHLADYPDLLLHQAVPLARPRPGQREADVEHAELIVCGRGIVFADVLFTEAPTAIEVLSRGLYRRGGHQLRIGDHAFELPDDPEPLARLLERWFRFHFSEFLPRVEEAVAWQSPAGDAILRTWGTVACPQCRRIIRTRPGEVGVALEEPAGSS
jgi:hypothetical protein